MGCMKFLISGLVLVLFASCSNYSSREKSLKQNGSDPTITAPLIEGRPYVVKASATYKIASSDISANAASLNEPRVELVEVAVSNAQSVRFVINKFGDTGVPGTPTQRATNNGLIDFGALFIADLFDNSLFCGDAKCDAAAIRIFTQGVGPGLYNSKINQSVPLTVETNVSEPLFQTIGFQQPNAVVVHTVPIGSEKYTLTKQDFDTNQIESGVYRVLADFTNAGTGTFEALLTVEYVLIGGTAPVPEPSAPFLSVNSPTQDQMVQENQFVISGGCEADAPIAVYYGHGLSGPLHPECSNGEYSATVFSNLGSGERGFFVVTSENQFGKLSSVGRNVLFQYSEWPFGLSGALVIESGQIVTIPAGSVRDYSYLRIDSGGKLVVDAGGGNWTMIGISGEAIINGSIEARNGQHTGGSFSTQAPDATGSLLGEPLNYGITQKSGGDGTGGNAVLWYSGGCGGYCSSTWTQGGLSYFGNGGGGGGGSGYDVPLTRGGDGENASSNASGAGGYAGSPGVAGGSSVTTYGANGINGTSGTTNIYSGSGGSGGFRGSHGQGLYLKFKNGATGTGAVSVAGKKGGNGGTGGAGGGDGNIMGGTGGAGGGGAGGSGGAIVIRYRDLLSNALNFSAVGGQGGTGANAGQSGDNGTISISTY